MQKKSKSKFPFRLATTSFIYPDDIVPNVEKLAPCFDEIELLILESRPPAVLPSENTVRRLAELAEQHHITYNVHLPLDIYLGHPAAAERDLAVATVQKTLALCAGLKPTTCTLHFELHRKGALETDIGEWVKRVDDSLEKLVPSIERPDIITVETLEYPFRYVAPLIEKWGLSVCIDAGHLIKHGFDITALFERHRRKVVLIHLHGVDFSKTAPKDHTDLGKTPAEKMAPVLEVLKTYTGVVSIEVFNRKDLDVSTAYLDALFT